MNVYTKVAPNTFFNVDEMGAKVTFDLEFIVNNETAIIIEVYEGDFFVNPKLDNFTFFIKIESVSIKNITTYNSQIGDHNLESLKTFLNDMFYLATPIINAYFATGFQVPNEFFGLIVVDHADFQSKDGYVSIIFSPHLIQ